MFVIKRDQDGKYVAPSGSEHSYTPNLEEARVYHTRKEAENDLCRENEKIYDITDVLRGFLR